jgi:hypothetical protein
MKRPVLVANATVLLHFVVSVLHGMAHRKLHVELSAAQKIFVLGVILIWPLLAALLLWLGQIRLGSLFLALSMSGSFLFGFYWHFAELSPDRIDRQISGTWGMVFVATAVLLAITEVLGTYLGLRLLRSKAA